MDTLYACDTYWFIPEQFRMTESTEVNDRFEVYERMPRADEVYADLLRQVVFCDSALSYFKANGAPVGPALIHCRYSASAQPTICGRAFRS